MNADLATSPRPLDLAARQHSRLVLVDVQERFVPHLPDAPALIGQCRRLIQGAQLLGVPVEATEQYPKGLGPTVPELREFFDAIPTKLRFSSAECLGWGRASERTDQRFQAVVCGIETHVCILQTALELIGLGYTVFIPADAVASRRPLDREFALRRLETSGAILTTTEGLLFEWCETAAAPEFKALQQLVKS